MIVKEQISSMAYRLQNPVLKQYAILNGMVALVRQLENITDKNPCVKIDKKRVDKAYVRALSLNDRSILAEVSIFLRK